MADRPYRCTDCPPGAPEHSAGPRGPLPERCPAHRAVRERQRGRRRRSPLRVVQADPQPPAPPAPESARPQAAEPEDDRAGPHPGPIQAALREDLAGVFSQHPAARTLERVADVLAQVLDSPVALVVDPKILPPLSRELRSIVQELVTHERAEEDDLFGGAGPVIVPG